MIYVRDNKYYFTDEVLMDSCGPFDSKEECEKWLGYYSHYLKTGEVLDALPRGVEWRYFADQVFINTKPT